MAAIEISHLVFLELFIKTGKIFGCDLYDVEEVYVSEYSGQDLVNQKDEI